MPKPLVRVGYWCPPEPQASGIAAYGSDLLRSLSSLVEATHVHPKLPGSVRIEGTKFAEVHEASVVGFDGSQVNIFHVGNHAAYHAWMLPAVLRLGGIVVLHELSLFDLYYALFRRFPEEWQTTLERNNVSQDFVLRYPISLEDRMSHHCLSDIVNAADVVMVHTQWAKARVLELFPSADVRTIPLASRVIESEDPGETSVVTVLGGIGRHKGTGLVLDAIGELVRELPTVEIRIVGRADDRVELKNLRRRIRDEGLRSRVTILTDVDEVAFDEELRRASVIVTLRPGTVGEMSSVLTRAWGAGRVTITSDQPQFREFPEEFCRRVPIKDDVSGALVSTISGLLSDRDALQRASAAARAFAEKNSFDHVAAQYAELAQQVANRVERPDVNVIAAWGSPTGLAENARRLAVGITPHLEWTAPYSFIIRGHNPTLVPREVIGRSQAATAPINVWTSNINEISLIDLKLLGTKATGSYNVGLWFYEFPVLPEFFRPHISLMDEVWAGSNFVADAFGRAGATRVKVIPGAVTLRSSSRSRDSIRESWGAGPDTLVVMCSFDYTSGWARKNPLGLVKAFRSAFEGEDALLLLKTSGLPDEKFHDLTAAVGSSRLRIINEYLSDEDVSDLFHATDVYASLHRAEGFGLGMAEAMAMGKTVVATRYSGNLDFMNDDNSLLVDASMTGVTKADMKHNPGMNHVVSVGMAWAEPSHAHAVTQLRASRDSVLRSRLGSAAAVTIRDGFSLHVVGQRVTARIREIQKYSGKLPEKS